MSTKNYFDFHFPKLFNALAVFFIIRIFPALLDKKETLMVSSVSLQ